MRVLSVTPLDGAAEPDTNLFPGGEFQAWWPGAPAPEGFRHAADAPSTLTRTPRTEGAGFRVLQVWDEQDNARALDGLLRTQRFRAEAGEWLELEVTAASIENQGAHIGLWMSDAAGNDYLLDPYFISLHPGVLKRYARAFTLPESGLFSFAVHGAPQDADEDAIPAVEWRGWRLLPGSPGQ